MSTIEKEDIKAVINCLRDGELWRGAGNRTDAIESAFAQAHQCQHALLVTNGSHAIEIALRAAGVGYGDEVIVPAYTFLASATAVLAANAVPVPVDVDSETMNIAPGMINQAITSRTKAIIPVHISGQPCDMKAIMAIARAHDLAVIEDCAHAHGAKAFDQSVGAFGNAGCFSFQSSKVMTCGEGGAIVTNSDAIHDQAMRLSNYGRRIDDHSYHHDFLGGNFRLATPLAMLLPGQLDRLAEDNATRQQCADDLTAELSTIPGLRLPKRAEYVQVQSWFNYVFRLPEHYNAADRDGFLIRLQKAGFPVRSAYPNFQSMPLFDQIGETMPHLAKLDHWPRYSDIETPIASDIAERGLQLLHNFVTADPAKRRAFVDRIGEIIAQLEA